jgi:uncharacterized membrane protein
MWDRLRAVLPAPLQRDGEPSTSTDTDTTTTVQPREQQIRTLLEEADGILRQKTLDDHLDCSPSTISRTLSQMEQEGTIVRKKVGREKLVARPHELDHHSQPTRHTTPTHQTAGD